MLNYGKGQKKKKRNHKDKKIKQNLIKVVNQQNSIMNRGLFLVLFGMI